jgi:hypothetical protein
MPSFGREVKQFVPCRRFAARKRTLLDYVEVESLRPNYSDVSRSKFPPSSRFAGAPSECPYTRAACAPTGDEWRQPKSLSAYGLARPGRIPIYDLPSTRYS